MKQLFNCKKCGVEYKATWSKGLCPTCRARKARVAYQERNYVGLDPNGHRVNTVYDHEDGDWLGILLPVDQDGRPHPIHDREDIEAGNALKRRHYQKIREDCIKYNTDYDLWV